MLNIRLSAKEIQETVKTLVNVTRQELTRVASLPRHERTFANTVQPLADLYSKKFVASTNCTFPFLVSPSAEARQASKEAKDVLQAFENECLMREDVYQALVTVKEKQAQQPLGQEEQRLLSKMLSDFERSGLGLKDEKERKQAKQLRDKVRSCCFFQL